jgi:hypothetical protein
VMVAAADARGAWACVLCNGLCCSGVWSLQGRRSVPPKCDVKVVRRCSRQAGAPRRRDGPGKRFGSQGFTG